MVKKMGVFILLVTIVGGVMYLTPHAYRQYWSIRGFLEPDMMEKGLERYREKPSSYLIHKLGSISPYNLYVALQVLSEREEKEATPYLINFLSSGDKYKRDSAMRALGKIRDKRAVGPLMEIIEEGREHPDFLMAMETLSQFQHEGIFEEILAMKRDDYHISWVVSMLRNYPDNPETIIALQEIAESDPRKYIRDKAEETLMKISR